MNETFNEHYTSTRHRALPYHRISQSFDLPPATTSVSHLTCPLPPHHQSELVLEIELALNIEHYHITASVSHLTCPLQPHQSCILTCPLPPHQSLIWLAPCPHISQSFDMPSTTATTSVSHLTCPLPLHHCITMSLRYHVTMLVTHLTCPLPPHKSVFWLALYHCVTAILHYCVSQSFDLPPPPHQSLIWLAPCHHISQSFDMPSTTATTSVSHLTCPLPLHPCITMSLRYHVTMLVTHLTCPLPPHKSVFWLALYYHITASLHYHISRSFDLPPATTSVSHLTCPL